MAGPFARLRRGGSEAPAPNAPTETLEPVAAEPAAENGVPAQPAAGAPLFPGADDAIVTEEPTPADTVPGEEMPGFVERGKLRRRLRFVHRARELALRDLGGLVFDLHRFGRERNDLVDQKLAALATLDSEMRALATLLDDHPDVTVLHEPGIASCPRCGALHASDAAYCSACGLPVGRGANLPSGPALAGPVPPTPAAAAQAATPAPEPDPANPADAPIATEAVPEGETPAPGEHPTATP